MKITNTAIKYRTAIVVLTLILVPVLYSLVDDTADFFKRHYTWSDESTPEASAAGADSRTRTPHEGETPAPGRPRGAREPVVAREGLRPSEA